MFQPCNFLWVCFLDIKFFHFLSRLRNRRTLINLELRVIFLLQRHFLLLVFYRIHEVASHLLFHFLHFRLSTLLFLCLSLLDLSHVFLSLDGFETKQRSFLCLNPYEFQEAFVLQGKETLSHV